MNSVLRIPLDASPEQVARLQALQSGFAQVCNALAPLVQQTRVWNRVALHHLAYRQLRERFPTVEVRAAAAHVVLREAADLPGQTMLVSSLPFRSLPPRLRLRSSVAIERFLTAQPGRRLVQYSYVPREPFPLRPHSPLRWRRLAAVWGNAPPAWVWELSAAPLT